MQLDSKATYFPNLDGVRGLACLVVFVCHAFDYLHHTMQSGGAEAWIYDHIIARAGAMGVSLFFVLSGFLITHLLLAEKGKYQRISFRFFYAKRILRIWPVFFTVVIAGFFIVPLVSGGIDFTAIREHLPWYVTFTNNFDRIRSGFTGINNDSLGVLWSVAVEEQFYLVWPLLILLLGRRAFPYAGLVIIAGAAWFRFAHYNSEDQVYYNSLSVAGDLAIGGLAAYSGLHSENFRRFFREASRPVTILIYIIIGSAILLHQKLLDPGIGVVPGRIVLTFAFALLIADQAYRDNGLFRMRQIPGLTKLGMISYGFYCYHLFVIMFAQKLNAHYGWTDLSEMGFYAEFLLVFAGTALLSYASYRIMERPLLRLRSKFQPAYFKSVS